MALRQLSRFAKGAIRGSFSLLPRRWGLFARRWLGWELLRGEARTMEFERGGFAWSVFADDIVGRGLFLHGEFQLDGLPDLLTWCAANVPQWEQRHTLINVGANIGATCLPLAQQSGRRCLAVEPVPATFDRLSRNVALNRMEDRVLCRQAAIASQPGTIEMVAPRDSGHSEVKTTSGKQGFTGVYAPEDCSVVSVPALPLTQLVAEAGLQPHDIGLVWSDTQGFEAEVIASGRPLWQSGTPLWVEVWPHGLETHGGIDRFLNVCRENFRHFILDDRFAAHTVQPQPISELAALIEQLQRHGGSRGRMEHDVLLAP